MTPRKTLAIALLSAALLPAAGLAVPGERGWQAFPNAGRCIGGVKCDQNGAEIRIPLEDSPVWGVRFFTHDDVGDRSRGHLRVRIDDRVLERDIDVPKEGRGYELNVDGLRGRYLIFETASDDEVVVDNIEVRFGGYGDSGHGGGYGGGGYDGGGYGAGGHGGGGYQPSPSHHSWPAGGSERGWRAYPEIGGCIGGVHCADNGPAIRIRLDSAPVLGVRFFAHDDVGDRSNGHLRVRIDGKILEHSLDIAKRGDGYELSVNAVRGRELVLETATDDEVVIEDVEVRYGRGFGGDDGRWQSYPRAGGCFGGTRCDQNGREIRIPLEDLPVVGVRFFTHDDVGDRSRGHLRVRIDSRVLEPDLDVPKGGDSFQLDVDDYRGRYLIFETVTDDEIVVEDIEVEYRYGRRPR